MPVYNIIQAVNDALKLEMRRNQRVVLLGEDVGNFGGVFRATDLEDGITVALEIIQDPARASTMGEAGRQFAQSHRGATERTIDLLTPLLKTARPDRPA